MFTKRAKIMVSTMLTIYSLIKPCLGYASNDKEWVEAGGSKKKNSGRQLQCCAAASYRYKYLRVTSFKMRGKFRFVNLIGKCPSRLDDGISDCNVEVR